MVAAIFGLIGVILGVGITTLTRWYDRKAEDKRHREKIAWKIASRELDVNLDTIKLKGEGTMAPVWGYYFLYYRLLEELAKGPINKNTIELVVKENKEIIYAFPGAPAKNKENNP